jgi:PST family polysaccharide transporter
VFFFKLKIDSQKLIKNVSWLLLTEVAAKASRFFVIVALAASVDAITYGTIMLALGCHEVLKLILRSGAGMQIIQCSDNFLPAYAKNGAVLQWLVCIALCLIQVGVAYPLSQFYDNEVLSDLLILMAGVYLLYPMVSVNVFLVQRAGNMRFFSLCNGACITSENLAIALFALLDCGAMSVVYGKWVYASFWVVMFYCAPVKRYGVGFHKSTFMALVKTSSQLFSTELVRSLRSQMDVLLGAKLLSPELFGIYSFSKSAGVGLSQSLINAFNSALYPYLCQQQRKQALAGNLRKVYMMVALVSCVFVAQVIAVPWYVPLIFEQQWQQNHTVVMFLCTMAIPTIFIDTHCNILRAHAAYSQEFYTRLFCMLVAVVGVLSLPSLTPEEFSINLLVMSFITLTIFLPWRRIPLFNQRNKLLTARSQPHE